MTDGRVAVVTGGAYGIGRGIVLEFVHHRIGVVIADRDDARGVALQAELRQKGATVAFIHCDVRVDAEIQNLIAEAERTFGRIDVLCNNAGVECYRPADQYTLDEWNNIVETNLRGTFLCTKYAFPHLKRSGHGSVVNISSVQAFANEPQISVYAATKAGILALTRGMALDFAAAGVRVNAVCPGAIQTGMMEAFLEGKPDPEQEIRAIDGTIPLGRVGQPKDIAQAVYFLASDAAAYITGAALVVDGGLLSRLST